MIVPRWAVIRVHFDTLREKYARRQQSSIWFFQNLMVGTGSVHSAKLWKMAYNELATRVKKEGREETVGFEGIAEIWGIFEGRDDPMNSPSKIRRLRMERMMYGTEIRVVKARMDVQMMVNLICHSGSITYELWYELSPSHNVSFLLTCIPVAKQEWPLATTARPWKPWMHVQCPFW
jgi:hypothetical protein